jgi:hypothetical protein
MRLSRALDHFRIVGLTAVEVTTASAPAMFSAL